MVTRLEERPDIASDGTALARLLSETVARQLLFILITVDDALNAYTVFETLSARGLELTTTDLLKNYLFSRVRVSADLEALRRRWRSLTSTVAPERFPEFLRYHLLCEEPKIRNQRLFKLVRDRTKTPEDVFVLLEALESRAELFAALSDPNHGYWVEIPEAQPYVRELNLFRVRQMTPLLFATYESFSHSQFVSVLRLVSVISFRYTIVGGLNPSALEAAYHLAAKAALDGSANAPADVFRRVTQIYVDDEKFEQDMSQMSLDTGTQRRKLAKYILARLESDFSGRPRDPDTDPGTVEHILPENPGEGWTELIPRDQWETNVYRLGNLTLLEPSLNREVGNGAYGEKSHAYRTSTYEITRTIIELAPDTWTPALIARRQRLLAQRSKGIWRVDYL